MSLVVVGSIAFDAVKTPFGEREKMLGGSAVHFSLAASFFTDVRVVGPVGDDFGEPEYEVLHARGVNTDDVEHVPGGDTFFWKGVYGWDLNDRETLATELGVFGEFEPKLSEASKSADTLFLANIQPDLQRQVRALCGGAKLSGLDSMNLWIDVARDSLADRSRLVDLTRERHAAGIDSALELKQAEAAVPAARERIDRVEETIELTRHQLAALLGEGPDRGAAITSRCGARGSRLVSSICPASPPCAATTSASFASPDPS